MWRGAIACGAVEIAGRWAYPRHEDGYDDEQWVSLGMRSAIRLLVDAQARPFGASGLDYALLRSYVRHCDPVSWEEILGFVADWERSADDLQSIGNDVTGMDRMFLADSIGALADTGIFTEDDQSLRLTPLGDVVVTAWLRYLEQ